MCERRCGVNRLDGERGYCGLGGQAYWFREMLHYGEEIDLIPTHTIYLAGCNMRCVFCTSPEWNAEPRDAEPWDVAAMKDIVLRRRAEGARNVNFLGGEPTVSLHAILNLLAELPESIPVVWDSNMYFSTESRELLDGVMDWYLADFKFGNDRCAKLIADAPNYVNVVTENLKFACDTANVIVRHVLLPGHLRCCFEPVAEWVSRELPRARLGLRGEYLPPPGPERADGLSRYLTDDERDKAAEIADKLGLELVH